MSAFLSTTLDNHLSLYSIPAAWLSAMMPNIMKVALINKSTGYNNVNPRGNVANLKKNGIPNDLAEKAARLEGAHSNGCEVLPLWIAAVLAGNYVQLSSRTLNQFSIAFISFRLLYNYVYANQKTRAHSIVRSGVWWLSMFCPLTLLVKAANKHALQ